MRGRSRGRNFGWLKTLFAVLAVALGLWGAGLFAFVASVPGRTPAAMGDTDAIVVLTGGSGRLREGLDLLLAGKAGELFVSGVYRGVDVAQLLAVLKQRPDEVEDRISLGDAVDTTENAEETAAWMAASGFGSLRLVTAAYHMPRSLLEFHAAMPRVRILPHPVFPDHVKQQRWWAWPGTTALLIGEYNKFLLAWLRIEVIGRLAGGRETPS